MKKFIFFARVCTWLTLVFPLSVSAQDTTSVYPNYVVIGAFAFKNNAVEFTDEANKKNKLPAKFEMNPNRNLFYVFVMTTPDREVAFAEALKLRTGTRYFDTWVYSGALGELGLTQRSAGQNQDLNPETRREIHSLSAEPLHARPRDGTVNSTSQNRQGKSAVNPGADADRSAKAIASGGTVSQGPSSPRNNNSESTIQGEEATNGVTTRTQTADSEVIAGQNLTDKNNGVSSGKKTTRKAAGQNSRQSAVQPDITQPAQEVTSPSQKNGLATARGEMQATNAAVNDQTARQANITSTRGSAEQLKQGNSGPGNADQNQPEKPASQREPTDIAAKDQASSDGNISAGQNSTQRSRQGGKVSPATGQESQQAGSPVTTSNAQQGVVRNKQSNAVGLAQGNDENAAITEETNTTNTAITRETDKSLTDAGRKALAENRERQAALGPPPQRATTAQLTKEEVTGKDFYFHLFRADNLEMVDGEVDAIDFEKSRRMATYQGNTGVKVTMPSGKTKQISFVCQVFGYRKQQREFDPAMPPEDLYLDNKGNLVVPFELVRMQKGDIAIMYNVFFFKDAAVMRPESRYEVNNLLDLLAENPTYKIMIHGHTNGNASGKIIRMDTPGNFYSLAGTRQGFGSAKELSEERAVVIRDFLINSGISAHRMQVKAWGGKKPIHDKHSVRANENVRVEIEILSE